MQAHSVLHITYLAEFAKKLFYIRKIDNGQLFFPDLLHNF